MCCKRMVPSCDIRTVDWGFSETRLLIGTKEGKGYHINLEPCVANASSDAQLTKVYNAVDNIIACGRISDNVLG